RSWRGPGPRPARSISSSHSTRRRAAPSLHRARRQAHLRSPRSRRLRSLGRTAARRPPSSGIARDFEMIDLDHQKSAELKRWQSAKVKPEWQPLIASVAKHLVDAAAKTRYQAVAHATNVPWPAIAVIHQRESSQSWLGSLAQGDPWNKPSIHVPRGRGPFKSWEDAAIDALTNCPPHAARWEDWSIGGAICALEAYNGE